MRSPAFTNKSRRRYERSRPSAALFLNRGPGGARTAAPLRQWARMCPAWCRSATDDLRKPAWANSPQQAPPCTLETRRTPPSRWGGRRWDARTCGYRRSRQFFDVRPQVLRPQRAVQAHGEGRACDIEAKRAHRLAGRCGRAIGDGPEIISGRCTPAFSKSSPRRTERPWR